MKLYQITSCCLILSYGAIDALRADPTPYEKTIHKITNQTTYEITLQAERKEKKGAHKTSNELFSIVLAPAEEKEKIFTQEAQVPTDYTLTGIRDPKTGMFRAINTHALITEQSNQLLVKVAGKTADELTMVFAPLSATPTASPTTQPSPSPTVQATAPKS